MILDSAELAGAAIRWLGVHGDANHSEGVAEASQVLDVDVSKVCW